MDVKVLEMMSGSLVTAKKRLNEAAAETKGDSKILTSLSMVATSLEAVERGIYLLRQEVK